MESIWFLLRPTLPTEWSVYKLLPPLAWMAKDHRSSQGPELETWMLYNKYHQQCNVWCFNQTMVNSPIVCTASMKVPDLRTMIYAELVSKYDTIPTLTTKGREEEISHKYFPIREYCSMKSQQGKRPTRKACTLHPDEHLKQQYSFRPFTELSFACHIFQHKSTLHISSLPRKQPALLIQVIIFIEATKISWGPLAMVQNLHGIRKPDT